MRDYFLIEWGYFVIGKHPDAIEGRRRGTYALFHGTRKEACQVVSEDQGEVLVWKKRDGVAAWDATDSSGVEFCVIKVKLNTKLQEQLPELFGKRM